MAVEEEEVAGAAGVETILTAEAVAAEMVVDVVVAVTVVVTADVTIGVMAGEMVGEILRGTAVPAVVDR